MNIFVDTCAFIALIDSDDEYNFLAAELFKKATKANEKFFTSNYIILETIFLLQRKLGLSAVNDFKRFMLPLINMIWIDEKIHDNCLNNLISAERNKISFTDYTSFYILDNFKIDAVFTFDKHFKEKGYKFLE
ncbi:MAG: PIN domain-containing protein [Actinobacteria bacterium]|nr:PIN domain-containing protein [Cyanobacteriota bacterium]MCL5771833.1 PIN domain-containing protein [Actinomycetota bacterium]